LAAGFIFTIEFLISETVKCKIDYNRIFETKSYPRGNENLQLCGSAPEYTETYEFRSNSKISKKEFYEFLNKFRNDILRAKGLIDFEGEQYFIEVVNGVVSSTRRDDLKLETGFRTAISFVLFKSKSRDFNESVAVFTHES